MMSYFPTLSLGRHTTIIGYVKENIEYMEECMAKSKRICGGMYEYDNYVGSGNMMIIKIILVHVV